jgi:hypothetical protein
MAEIEVPLEQIQEHIHEAAHNASGEYQWIGYVALYSAIVAVLAAISAMLAGGHANEAMLSQIKASNSWSYYQAKGVKAAVLSSKMQLLEEMGRAKKATDETKLEEYKKEQEDIMAESKKSEAESAHHLHSHETLAKSVTLFQVAIAIAAISVLARRRRFWFVSMAFSFFGIGLFLMGLNIFSH